MEHNRGFFSPNGVKRVMLSKPDVLQQQHNNQQQQPGQMSLNFTPVAGNAVYAFPDDDPTFWTQSDVYAVGNLLLVRRYDHEGQDLVYLNRLNARGSPSRFKFPGYLLPQVLLRMENLISRAQKDDRGKYSLDSLSEISKKDDFVNEAFWKSSDTIKALNFHMKPYKSEFNTLCVRFWMDIGGPKMFETEHGFKTWLGPCNYISFDNFVTLFHTFKKLNNKEDESTDSQRTFY